MLFGEPGRPYFRASIADLAQHQRETAIQLAMVRGCGFDSKAFEARRLAAIPRWNIVAIIAVPNSAGMWARVLRPRVLIYGALLLALCILVLGSLVMRTPLKVDVVRDRAALSRIVAGGKLENVYRLQVMNATEQPQRYRISAAGLRGLQLVSDAEVTVGPAESRWVPVRLQVP